MIDGTLLLAAVLGALLLERCLELVINLRNLRRLVEGAGAHVHARDGFLGIVLVQVLAFIIVPAEWFFAPWSGLGVWTWIGLALVVAANLLRYWCITTLGDRWTVRVVTVPNAPVVTSGPYRFLRHPNYVAVMIELPALALAFGCVASALLIAARKGAALANRIRREERALRAETPWGETMGGKGAFFPRH